MSTDDIDEKKIIAFYQAGVTAWYNTSLEHDKSLLTLSAGGIGLLMTLIKTVGVSSAEMLILYVASMISFLSCLVAVLIIFKKNRTHIEEVFRGHEGNNSSLEFIDNIAIWSFGFAIVFSSIIGISSAINSYTTRILDMTNEKTKQTSTNTMAYDSVNGISGLKPATESFNGVNALQPTPVASQSNAQPASTTTSQTVTPSNSNTGNVVKTK